MPQEATTECVVLDASTEFRSTVFDQRGWGEYQMIRLCLGDGDVMLVPCYSKEQGCFIKVVRADG